MTTDDATNFFGQESRDAHALAIGKIAIAWNEYHEALSEIYAELCNEATVYPRHLFLGHSDDSQPYAIEGGYHMVRTAFWPELPVINAPWQNSHPEYRAIRLLLQLDAANETGMRFGRGGPVYFGIYDEDLRNRDFSKAWARTQ